MGRLRINNKIRQSLVANRVVSDNIIRHSSLKMEKWTIPTREGLHSHAPPFSILIVDIL